MIQTCVDCCVKAVNDYCRILSTHGEVYDMHCVHWILTQCVHSDRACIKEWLTWPKASKPDPWPLRYMSQVITGILPKSLRFAVNGREANCETSAPCLQTSAPCFQMSETSIGGGALPRVQTSTLLNWCGAQWRPFSVISTSQEPCWRWRIEGIALYWRKMTRHVPSI